MLARLNGVGDKSPHTGAADADWPRSIVVAVWHRRHRGWHEEQEAIPEETRDLVEDLMGVKMPVEPADIERAQRTRRELESLSVRQIESKRHLMKAYKLAMLTLAELVHDAEGSLAFTGSFARGTIATVRRRLKLDGG